MDDREKRAVASLAMMVDQYLQCLPDDTLDSLAMSASEHAIGALAEYGYMEEMSIGRIFGRWTKLGEALLDWSYPFNEQAAKEFPMPTGVP